jgi:uncharacterized YigZ family protein
LQDIYKTIAAPATGVFKDKGSKFLAYAFPVDNEAEIKQHIQQLKKEYFDARHHCYAYRLGLNGELWRANDDGEPSSTGGKPILGELLSTELTNVLVVVVRYFGGILLGVSGLINAYRSATADALAQAQIIEKVAKEILTINFSYFDMNKIMKLIKEEELEIITQRFDNDCEMKLAVPLSKKDRLLLELSSLSIFC